jgi:hypothetical protein
MHWRKKQGLSICPPKNAHRSDWGPIEKTEFSLTKQNDLLIRRGIFKALLTKLCVWR